MLDKRHQNTFCTCIGVTVLLAMQITNLMIDLYASWPEEEAELEYNEPDEDVIDAEDEGMQAGPSGPAPVDASQTAATRRRLVLEDSESEDDHPPLYQQPHSSLRPVASEASPQVATGPQQGSLRRSLPAGLPSKLPLQTEVPPQEDTGSHQSPPAAPVMAGGRHVLSPRKETHPTGPSTQPGSVQGVPAGLSISPAHAAGSRAISAAMAGMHDMQDIVILDDSARALSESIPGALSAPGRLPDGALPDHAVALGTGGVPLPQSASAGSGDAQKAILPSAAVGMAGSGILESAAGQAQDNPMAESTAAQANAGISLPQGAASGKPPQLARPSQPGPYGSHPVHSLGQQTATVPVASSSPSHHLVASAEQRPDGINPAYGPGGENYTTPAEHSLASQQLHSASQRAALPQPRLKEGSLASHPAGDTVSAPEATLLASSRSHQQLQSPSELAALSEHSGKTASGRDHGNKAPAQAGALPASSKPSQLPRQPSLTPRKQMQQSPGHNVKTPGSRGSKQSKLHEYFQRGS